MTNEKWKIKELKLISNLNSRLEEPGAYIFPHCRNNLMTGFIALEVNATGPQPQALSVIRHSGRRIKLILRTG